MYSRINQAIEDYKNGKTTNFSNKEFIQFLIFLTAENDRKDKALQFYADDVSHNKLLFDKYAPYTAIEGDEGKIAKEALGGETK